LVPEDTNPVSDIYVLNIDSGRIELVSLGANGMASKDSSSTPRLSGDGRYVAYDSVTPRPHAACATVFMWGHHDTAPRPLATAWNDRSRVVCATRPTISSDGQWVGI
jgi:Tol biopolymer transport system component